MGSPYRFVMGKRRFALGDAPLSKRNVYVRPLWERGRG